MRIPEVLAAWGIDASVVETARSKGRVVGKGEGFTSREWREIDGAVSLVLAVHDDADGNVVSVQAHVTGLGWATAALGPVAEAPATPHDAVLSLRFGDADLVAALPDAAARRRMVPSGFDAQVSVIVFPEALPDGTPGTIDVKGPVAESRAFTILGRPAVASRVVVGSGAVWVITPTPGPSSPVDVRGRGWVRVGASSRGRTAAKPSS